MFRESSLYPMSRTESLLKKLDSDHWPAIFQIVTVIGAILVLVSLLLLF